VFASPLAKKLASERGIELAAIRGTGPHNRIIAADVEEYVPGELRPFAMTCVCS
jgi:pyruvate dehydrogenase E2 component (dihydrolipoamide acetyltransferase)